MTADIKASYNQERICLGEALPLNTPLSIILDVSERCNFLCNYCFRSGQKDGSWDFAQKNNLMTMDIFQKAVDDYNSGFVEVDYTFRSVASIRVEEAMEDAGRVSEEFKPAQIKVIYEAAEADLNLEHYMNPNFSASHMKFIMEQEKAGKDVTWLPIGKILHRSIVEKPLTRDQIRRIKERMQRAEPKDSVIADLHEKKKEAARVPKKQGQQKEKGER